MRVFLVLLGATIAGALAALAIAVTGAGLSLELATLRVRLAVASPAPSDPRIILVDGGDALDPERLADVVELARAHGARVQGLLTIPTAPNDRLSAAVEECRCVVVPESHLLVSVAAARSHVGVDVGSAVPRVPFSAGTWPTFALAVARIGGAPASVEGREQAFVRARTTPVLSLDDVIAPRVDLEMFRGALVLVGPRAQLPVHASVLDDLMNDRLLEAPPLAFTVAFGVALALLGALAGSRRRPWLRFGLLALVPLLLWVNAATAFVSADVWLPLAAPSLAFAIAFTVALVAMRVAHARDVDGYDGYDDEDDEDDEDDAR